MLYLDILQSLLFVSDQLGRCRTCSLPNVQAVKIDKQVNYILLHFNFLYFTCRYTSDPENCVRNTYVYYVDIERALISSDS